MSSSVEGSPAPSPANINSTHAPKYGTVIPNRIFVGGISASTTEGELKTFFSSYGSVKDTKIIADRAGVSKGRYGFVTFENEEDARKIQKEQSDSLVFKERKLNIGPAIRKQVTCFAEQPYQRLYDAAQPIANGAIFYSNGIPYTYHNGMAIFPSPEAYQMAAAQPQAYPMMIPQPVYVSQAQYSYQSPSQAQWQAATSQWRWATPSHAAAPTQYMYPTVAATHEMIQYGHPQSHMPYPQSDMSDMPMIEASPAEKSKMDGMMTYAVGI